MLGTIVSIFLFGSHLFGASAHLSSFIGDADAALNNSDALHAYRSYIFLETAKPQQFYKIGMAGYLQSIFLLGTPAFVKGECDRLASLSEKNYSSKAAYLCGLEFTEFKKTDEAIGYLSKIDHTSHFFWPAQLVLATDDFFRDAPIDALKRLPIGDVGFYRKLDLENQFHLSRARALVALGKADEALREYQAVTSQSGGYVNALQEMALLFFKMKKYETSQVLIDVIKTNYEGSFRGIQKINVPSSAYYDVRYLEAYIDLVQQRTDSALNLFEQLQKDNQKFYDRTQYDLDVVASVKVVKEQGMRWTDSRDFPDVLQNQFQLISSWLPPEVKLKLGREIILQLAYVHEATRNKSNASEFKEAELKTYKSNVDRLSDLTLKEIQTDLTDALRKAMQNISAFGLKSRLGKLEAVSIIKAQGTRSLDEVIDDYSAKIHQMNEFAPP